MSSSVGNTTAVQTSARLWPAMEMTSVGNNSTEVETSAQVQ